MPPRPYSARKRRRNPDAAAAQPLTTITSLGDDVLAEILVRLPSLASLARAALACPWWFRLASSCDFLRRFRALHHASSPPLLGCFLSFVGADSPFHRAKVGADRDLAAAVRGGDFLLTRLEEGSQWRVIDCRHGFVLLSGRGHLCLFNPVSQSRLNVCRPSPTGYRYYKTMLDDNFISLHSCPLPDSNGDETTLQSFRLVSLEATAGGQACANEYSFDTGEWRLYPPSIKAPAPLQVQGHDHSNFPSMHAAGRIYWKYPSRYRKGDVLLSLDATTGGSMKFSLVALPLHVPHQAPYVVGETEDGTCCLVCVKGRWSGAPSLQVWLRNEEAGSWELETEVKRFPCDGNCLEKVIRVCSVTAGVVLLSLDHGGGRHRYLAFRLKNMNAAVGAAKAMALEADFVTCRGMVAYPYLMAWPPPLLQ